MRPKESDYNNKMEYIEALDQYQKEQNGKDSEWLISEIERLTKYYKTLKKVFNLK